MQKCSKKVILEALYLEIVFQKTYPKLNVMHFENSVLKILFYTYRSKKFVSKILLRKVS